MSIINLLDTDLLREKYQDKGYVIIPDFLRQEIALSALECMRSHVSWELHFRKAGSGRVGIVSPQELKNLTQREIKRLVPDISQPSDGDFSFAYCRYTIPSRVEGISSRDRVLSDIYRYFNSSEYIRILSEITGDESGQEVSAWASRYDRNHFLSAHRDESSTQTRIAAHVLGMSLDWKSTWGGNFAFCDEKGNPETLVAPRFNQLLLFKVPRLHLVTKVEPSSTASRYSIFGWYKKEKEYFLD